MKRGIAGTAKRGTARFNCGRLPQIAVVYAEATGHPLEELGRVRGSQTVAPCPAAGHIDRHPSCSINLEKNVFYCHSCGAHGGVLDLWVVAGYAKDRSEAASSLRNRGLMKP